MKKMTNKEFKEILKKADVDIESCGYEHILNMLSLFFDHEAEYENNEGFDACAKHDKERADIIFNELNKRNYYGRR